jgi:hypothetical protein
VAAGPAHDRLRAVAGSTQNFSGRSKLKLLLETMSRGLIVASLFLLEQLAFPDFFRSIMIS